MGLTYVMVAGKYNSPINKAMPLIQRSVGEKNYVNSSLEGAYLILKEYHTSPVTPF